MLVTDFSCMLFSINRINKDFLLDSMLFVYLAPGV
jgi:hypothetical protein